MRTLNITCDRCDEGIVPNPYRIYNPEFRFYSSNGVLHCVDLCDSCYNEVLRYTAPLLEKILRRDNGSSEPVA